MTASTGQVNAISPALRAILAEGEEHLSIVRFEEERAARKAERTMKFDCSQGTDAAAIVAALKTRIGAEKRRATAVNVAGMGVFRASDPSVSSGRAAGKVAVVTGAAQGFGLEIAQDLAAEGACVALCDINVEGARKAAEEICARLGGEGARSGGGSQSDGKGSRPGQAASNKKRALGVERAVGIEMNVTDSGSVAAAIHEIVRFYGGFDLFVSNAGVLKAESVKTQPEKDFDLVTAVNYKGYYLCVQHAAPIMAVQHMARPSYMSDIIQINSKSGLVGSNRNFAYAGSKFGGIGLTQSFAMELIEDGIKVNSICPGNFFDGPLWSDPENGLFVQYLRAKKVPGAKTIADVRHAYEAKVPMGRGCETADVMKAIYYLMEQRYETGQALPVTGGQVMLK